MSERAVREQTAVPQIELAGESEAGDWEAFVASHPAASAYHQWRWRSVFEQASGHETAYLLARADGYVGGVLPLVLCRSALFGRFAVRYPLSTTVACSLPTMCARALLAGAEHLAAERGLAHVDLRHGEARFPELPSKRHKVAMRLRLPSAVDQAWNGLDWKVRNQIRKPKRASSRSNRATPRFVTLSTAPSRGTCAIWARPFTIACS